MATPTAGPEPGLARARWLVELADQACAAYDRPDLVAAMRQARARLADPAVHVVVVGEFKQGKSSLVNALTGTTACPVDDDIATATPTYIRYGEEPSAALLVREQDAEGHLAGVRREPIPLTELRQTILEGDPVGTTEETTSAVTSVEVRVPRQLLKGGLVFVDTPGAGGLSSAHAASTLAAASLAQALVFVTDASQELTRPEADFLRQAREACDTVICVMTKTDLYPYWRKVKRLTEEHLAEIGVNTAVIGVSSPLRTMAIQSNDQELNAESGFPDLIAALGEHVGNDAERVLAADVAADVGEVCEQLAAQFRGERAVLDDPAQAKNIVAELSSVQQQVQQLKSAASRWNQTLSDGIADLTSDVDHDLRARIRQVMEEATASIEASDPADTWGEMEAWLQARVSHEMLANHGLLRGRATELSELVGEHFRQASGEVLDRIAASDPQPALARQEIDHKIDLDRMKAGQQAMVALKSAYGGAIMFVMLGMLTGITLGPIALGIGLVMGHRGLREEKRRQMKQRQQQATAAVRQYLDKVSFAAGKESRDSLRAIQRQLRDHYTGLAEQLEKSNNEALRRAQAAANASKADRARRLADVDAELARIAELRELAAVR